MEDVLRSWVPLSASIIALGTAVWGILQGPSRKNADAITGLSKSLGGQLDELDQRVDKAEKDLTALQVTISQLPTKNDFHELDRGLTEMRGKIETITKSQQAAEFSLQRIEGFLINNAGSAR